MLEILIFRIVLLLSFMISALFFCDWKNWQKYYPTAIFVMAINLFASFLTYHHILWNYHPDILIKTQTTVELINSFFMLPVTAFIFLSRFPTSTKLYQYGYVFLFACIYAGLEFIDHYIVGGISYKNGWSWKFSSMFDCVMFSIIRIHYSNPLLAWVMTFLLGFIILIIFNFRSGEFK